MQDEHHRARLLHGVLAGPTLGCMDQPAEERYLKDLGSTEGIDPTDVGDIQDAPLTAADEVDLISNQAVPDAEPSVETLAGNLGLEDSPADNPTRDDRFTGGSR